MNQAQALRAAENVFAILATTTITTGLGLAGGALYSIKEPIAHPKEIRQLIYKADKTRRQITSLITSDIERGAFTVAGRNMTNYPGYRVYQKQGPFDSIMVNNPRTKLHVTALRNPISSRRPVPKTDLPILVFLKQNPAFLKNHPSVLRNLKEVNAQYIKLKPELRKYRQAQRAASEKYARTVHGNMRRGAMAGATVGFGAAGLVALKKRKNNLPRSGRHGH